MLGAVAVLAATFEFDPNPGSDVASAGDDDVVEDRERQSPIFLNDSVGAGDET
jgi:hypothetical protein